MSVKREIAIWFCILTGALLLIFGTAYASSVQLLIVASIYLAVGVRAVIWWFGRKYVAAVPPFDLQLFPLEELDADLDEIAAEAFEYPFAIDDSLGFMAFGSNEVMFDSLHITPEDALSRQVILYHEETQTVRMVEIHAPLRVANPSLVHKGVSVTNMRAPDDSLLQQLLHFPDGFLIEESKPLSDDTMEDPEIPRPAKTFQVDDPQKDLSERVPSPPNQVSLNEEKQAHYISALEKSADTVWEESFPSPEEEE